MSKSEMVVKALCVVAVLLMVSAPTVFAQCDMSWQNDVCIGDNDYDCDVDGSDAAVFKSHFGRSGFNDPCPPNGPEPVPKAESYTHHWGYEPIGCGKIWPSPRFTDHGDGTVTDNLTGLMWTKSVQQVSGLKTHTEARLACQDLVYATYDDWHLPTIKELQSLIDFTYYDPALPEDHPFLHYETVGTIWSSTRNNSILGYWWNIWLPKGDVKSEPDNFTKYVWCVRPCIELCPGQNPCETNEDCLCSPYQCCCEGDVGWPREPTCESILNCTAEFHEHCR